MDLRSEIVRDAIVFELNSRLPGKWMCNLPSQDVISFTHVDIDGTNERQYSWAVNELKLAYSTGEVTQIIARKVQEQLAIETKAQAVMKKILKFK